MKFIRTQKPQDVEPTGRIVRYFGVYQAFVKDNTDAQLMGRLRVWIPEFNSRENDEKGWFTVSYVSPFAGATDPTKIGPAQSKQIGEESQTSYGWWAIPPDINNQVLVMFVSGDPSKGVWIGSFYQQNMNYMVPGLSAGNNYQYDKPVPVTEYNKNTDEKPRNAMTRPKLTKTTQALADQGLLIDTIRGISNSSARREAPSQVYGLSTPGPIDPDGKTDSVRRTGGSQLYLDDGTEHEHIRIRTRSGAQILIDETNGMIYTINKAGTAWLELDPSGHVDIFGAKSFTVRAQEDVNLRADRDVNIEAGRTINIKAAKDYTASTDGSIAAPGGGQSGLIKIEALGAMETKVVDKYTLQVANDISVKTTAGFKLEANNNLSFKTNNELICDAAGNLSIKAGSTIHQQAGGSVNIDGSNIALNDGAASPSAAPAAATVPDIVVRPKTNVLATFTDIFTRNTGNAKTIGSRFTTYEPCPEHGSDGNPYDFEAAEAMINETGRYGPVDDDISEDKVAAYPPDKRTPGTAVATDTARAPKTATTLPPECGDITSVDYSYRLSPNFSLAQLSIACTFPHQIRAQHGYTDLQIVCHLKSLANNILEPLRAQYPGFKINSGFRGNTGGTSQHERGMAVDIQWPGKSGAEYLKRAQWVRDNLPFDQLIMEHGNSVWLHISFDPYKSQRYQVLTMKNGSYESGLRQYYS